MDFVAVVAFWKRESEYRFDFESHDIAVYSIRISRNCVLWLHMNSYFGSYQNDFRIKIHFTQTHTDMSQVFKHNIGRFIISKIISMGIRMQNNLNTHHISVGWNTLINDKLLIYRLPSHWIVYGNEIKIFDKFLLHWINPHEMHEWACQDDELQFIKPVNWILRLPTTLVVRW